MFEYWKKLKKKIVESSEGFIPLTLSVRIMLFIGTALQIADTITDLFVLNEFYTSNKDYFAISLVFFILPACVQSLLDLLFGSSRLLAIPFFFLNISQIRIAYEAILSNYLGFISEDFPVIKMCEMLLESFPQIIIQTYVLFAEDNDQSNLLFISISFAFVNIGYSLMQFENEHGPSRYDRPRLEAVFDVIADYSQIRAILSKLAVVIFFAIDVAIRCIMWSLLSFHFEGSTLFIVIAIRYIICYLIWVLRINETSFTYASRYLMAILLSVLSTLTEYAMSPFTRMYPTRGEMAINPSRNELLLIRMHLLSLIEFIITVVIILIAKPKEDLEIFKINNLPFSQVELILLICGCLMLIKIFIFITAWLPITLMSESLHSMSITKNGKFTKFIWDSYTQGDNFMNTPDRCKWAVSHRLVGNVFCCFSKLNSKDINVLELKEKEKKEGIITDLAMSITEIPM